MFIFSFRKNKEINKAIQFCIIYLFCLIFNFFQIVFPRERNYLAKIFYQHVFLVLIEVNAISANFDKGKLCVTLLIDSKWIFQYIHVN